MGSHDTKPTALGARRAVLAPLDSPVAALEVRTADLGRSQPPRWAWEHRIVLGYLNLVLGNEGIGKGTFAAWVIAQWTRGNLPGDLRGVPTAVGIIGDEDSFDGVWTPRLHAAGADLERVHIIERAAGDVVDVKADRAELSAAITAHGITVLYADQILDNLGSIDDWRNKQVRDALQPLRALARELDVAVIGSLHPNKRADSFRQLVSGSSAFNAVSRSSLLLAEHPDDESRRVLVRGKGNLAAAAPGIEFTIANHTFTANGHTFHVPKAQDFKTSELVVQDLVGDSTQRVEHSKVADAVDLLHALLPHDDEWHPARAIYEACAAEGIEEHTVKRAKRRLSLEHRRESGFKAGTEWRWPTRDVLSTSAQTARSVPSAPSSSCGSKHTQNTLNTQDTANASPELVLSANGRGPRNALTADIEDLA